jgi:hypothetical protein
MRQIGRLFVATGVLAALMTVAPSAAFAASNEAVIAQNETTAQMSQAYLNTINDATRCLLAAQGVPVPGKNLAFSQPGPVPLTTLCAAISPNNPNPPTITAPPVTTANCVLNTRALTKFEGDLVNDYEIAVLKAAKNGLPAPAMSADVMALIGGC